MSAKYSLTWWLVAFAIVVTLVVISYSWLGLPIAIWAHRHPPPSLITTLFAPLGHVFDPLVSLAYVGLFLVGLIALARRSVTQPLAVALAATLSIIISNPCNAILKYIFGRSPPGILFSGPQPGQLTYGFNWFYSGASSFPSGHSAAACALLIVLWRCYPRGRPLYVLIALALAAVMITMDFHFVSDVIAGAFLGALIGWWVAQAIDKRFEICA